MEQQQPIDDAQLQQLQNQNNNKDKSGIQLSVSNKDHDVMVEIIAPAGMQRTPLDICCVVDTSGSMGSEASTGKNSEQNGLSILDIVKHAIKTIIHNLEPQDKLSIVNYDDNASIAFELTSMDQKGRDQALKATENLALGGCTNLWDGLHTGLEMIKNKSTNRNSTVMLFTDGLPNVNPPRGYIPTLKKYLDENKVNCSVNTFGFGYSLDSQLLNEIAQEANGTYAFIPDCGLVGTVFINALSNLLCTMATRVVLSLEPLNGAALMPNQDKKICGYSKCVTAQWGANIELGAVLYEQNRNVAFQMDFKNHKQGTPYLFCKVSFLPLNDLDVQQGERIIEADNRNSDNQNHEVIQTHIMRAKMVDVVGRLVGSQVPLVDSQKVLKNLDEDFQKCPAFQNQQNQYLHDLHKDLTGQISEAYSKQEFFNKWGRHYLPSLLSAHTVQQQNNFKDPGVQHYGGKLFNSIRDKSEATFTKLPPPKPTRKVYNDRGQQQQVRKPVNMARYNDRCGGCFAQNCKILMADGSLKNVQDVKKGDMIKGGDIQKVQCIVKTVCQKMDLVYLEGGCVLTPYHPLKIQGKWVFPLEIGKVEVQQRVEAVYSFLLEDRKEGKSNTVNINGYEGATLGHMEKGKVIEHSYFGTDQIVNDLEKMEGWEQGQIVLQAECIKRDEKSGLIVGMIQDRQKISAY